MIWKTLWGFLTRRKIVSIVCFMVGWQLSRAMFILEELLFMVWWVKVCMRCGLLVTLYLFLYLGFYLAAIALMVHSLGSLCLSGPHFSSCCWWIFWFFQRHNLAYVITPWLCALSMILHISLMKSCFGYVLA